MANKPRKRKPPAKKHKKDDSRTLAGITDRNPFFPYVDHLLQDCIAPHLDRCMIEAAREGKPIQTREQLLRAYKSLTGSRVSMTTFKAWLDRLGYQRQQSFGRTAHTAPAAAPAAPAAPAPTTPPPGEPEDNADLGDFDNLV